MQLSPSGDDGDGGQQRRGARGKGRWGGRPEAAAAWLGVGEAGGEGRKGGGNIAALARKERPGRHLYPLI